MPTKTVESNRLALGVRVLGSVAAVVLLALATLYLPLGRPFVGYGLAGAFLLHVASRPRRKELLIALAVAMAYGVAYLLSAGRSYRISLEFCCACLGIGSFVVLAVNALWLSGEARRRALDILGPAAALAFFILASQRLLNLPALLHPKTWDLYLFSFDGSLGFQPSFVLGQWFQRWAWLRVPCVTGYDALPLGLAAVYAGHMQSEAPRRRAVLEVLLLAGILGWAAYSLFPATGPLYVFQSDFPWHPLPFALGHRLLAEPIPMALPIPRNAMPSLHMAWALLIWFNARRFSIAARLLAVGYVLITVVATLGTGEHYAIDLLVGVPFAVMLQALGTRWLPLSRRATAIAGGAAMTAFWLVLLRVAPRLFWLSPLIGWVLMAATAAGSALLLRNLEAAPDSMRNS